MVIPTVIPMVQPTGNTIDLSRPQRLFGDTLFPETQIELDRTLGIRSSYISQNPGVDPVHTETSLRRRAQLMYTRYVLPNYRQDSVMYNICINDINRYNA